ncbi:DUF5107 domain-containing protein [Streptomyces sp. NPDC058657]|uniref:DUF5107 domain-containing protein n=1 Tax=unclassified Streptomyces TaxID=2593676 RepID=UPI00365290F1
MATTVRRAVLTLPAAPLGPENPLPALCALDRVHVLDERAKETMPRDMARQLGHAPPRTPLPVRTLDGYGRERTDTDFDAVVIENARLRVTVLPGLGGRIHSLHDKASGRELVHRNPVLQPADFALNGAWFSGGIEWNIGATGHTTLTCAPLHAAVVPAPDGGDMVRLWEWERLRDLPFQVDLWLPADSAFLYVGVRIRNPHERSVPAYWWSNTAVEQTDRTRVLAPADEAWHFGYEQTLSRVPVPRPKDVDRSYPARGDAPADYFYEVPEQSRKWIAALDGAGRGLVQTSTDTLRGRKLFLWGTGDGGRRWQEWLTEPGAPGYAEIQAGLARTQLEHVPLDPGAEFSWLEAYGPLAANPAAVHSEDWAAARAAAEHALEAALPRDAVEEARTAWLAHADLPPGEILATGSGWGALEVLRAGHELPGIPFRESTLGEQQAPWLELLRTGVFPQPGGATPPGPTLVAPHWRDMLETAPAEPLTEYHLGVAQWHAGDLAQAVRSWERGLRTAASRWPLLRCLALADREAGNGERAADLYAEAFAGLRADRGESEEWTAATAALGREAVEALLAAGRPGQARTVWAGVHPGTRAKGRFRLVEAVLLAAEGDTEAARAVFDAGFEVADLREGSTVLSDVWATLTDEPVPAHYDFRLRAGEG